MPARPRTDTKPATHCSCCKLRRSLFPQEHPESHLGLLQLDVFTHTPIVVKRWIHSAHIAAGSCLHNLRVDLEIMCILRACHFLKLHKKNLVYGSMEEEEYDIVICTSWASAVGFCWAERSLHGQGRFHGKDLYLTLRRNIEG